MKDSGLPALVIVVALLLAAALVYGPRILAAVIEWGKATGIM